MTTESDRELLELAAKAYWGDEIDDVCSIRWLEEDQAIGYTHGDNQDHNGVDREFVWNPLADDGDALRLAVKLGIKIELHPSWVYARAVIPNDPFSWREITEGWGITGEPLAATRRAIVRAAAAIARATHKEGA